MKTLIPLMIGLLSVSLVGAACYDSDAGINPYRAGFVVSNNIMFTDHCMTSHQVIEMSCGTDGNAIATNHSCIISCHDTRYYSVQDIYSSERWLLDGVIGQCRGTGGGRTSTAITSSPASPPVTVVEPPVSPPSPPINPPVCEPECGHDHDCAGDEYCDSEGTCEQVFCPYGFKVNHRCVACVWQCIAHTHKSLHKCQDICEED